MSAGAPEIPMATMLKRAKALELGFRPHGALSFQTSAAGPKEFDLLWHEERAKTIAGLFAVQVKAAAELGLAAAPMRINFDANPFAEKRLADAWASGWVIGNDGASS